MICSLSTGFGQKTEIQLDNSYKKKIYLWHGHLASWGGICLFLLLHSHLLLLSPPHDLLARLLVGRVQLALRLGVADRDLVELLRHLNHLSTR